MFTLLVLAYNEEKYIEETIKDYVNDFEKIVVINDASKDSTLTILENLKSSYKNIEIINNLKNLGAGKSLEKAIQQIAFEETKYLIKIDGDNQFKSDDIIRLKEIAEKNNYDFIKCDRFWDGGIEGEIPMIRYLGNSFASLLLKISTSNWYLNDPLNGLFLISTKHLQEFKIPKLFKRYGYPFYISTYFSNLSIEKNLKYCQIKNTISYRNESSNLKATTMFFKLVLFTIYTLIKKIKQKMKYSSLQLTSLLDIFGFISFFGFVYSVIKLISIRYFSTVASQANWFNVSFVFLVLFVSIFFISQKIEHRFKQSFFYEIN